MLKKSLAISFILLALPAWIWAQPSLERWVIGSAGGAYTGPGLMLDYTAGEVVINTVGSPSNILTQGFHQPGGILVSVPENLTPEPLVSVFPNPVTDRININIQNSVYNKFDLAVYDLMGRIILKQELKISGGNSGQTSLDLANAAPGNYFIRITAGSDFRQVSKFIKVQP